MGWTYLQKPNDMSVIEFFKKEFATDNDRVKIEVLDGADLGSEVYLATKITPKVAWLRVSETLVPADDGSVIFAIVCLIDKTHGRYNFGYKDMYEDMGPYAHHCPANILDMLSPLQDPDSTMCKFAARWRNACRNNAAEAA